MEIILDLSFFEDLAQLPWYLVIWKLFVGGGWVLVLFLVFWKWYPNWIKGKQKKFLETVEYVLLAIDVPKANEQGPKAVESIFAQLAAGESGAKTFQEKNLLGVMETPLSLELISMEGYIQFLIRVPKGLRDLAETAVYAQYPEAEITEVEDYMEDIPKEFPDKTYELWGTEFVLYNKNPFPIRTYKEFEDMTSLERFKDPMASILEVMSKIGRGENMWLQILLVPAQPDWIKESGDVIKVLLGGTVDTKPNPVDVVLDFPLKLMARLHELIFNVPAEEKKSDAPTLKPGDLTPGARKVLEAVQNKTAKIAFKTKMRFVYWADKNVFSKGRGIASFVGALKQFNTFDMNGFAPDKKTKTSGEGLFPAKDLARKQADVVKYYAMRAFHKGAPPFVLNTEELATIYHFPMQSVKAPLLKTAETRRAEAPVSLPVDGSFEIFDGGSKSFNGVIIQEKAEPPKDLPTG